MFSIHRKIRTWQNAGLISPDQASSITAFERNRQKGRFSGGLIGLSIFAILVGVLMVVGANWAHIDDSVKLIAHAGLNVGAVVAIWHFTARDMGIWREGAVVVLAGLTLTFMALVGQVYQLHGGAGGLLALWLVLITPFMILYGRTLLTAVPWLLAFWCSIPVIFDQYISDLPDIWSSFYAISIGLLLPLGFCADGFTRMFRAFNPAWAHAFMRAGFIVLTLSAVGATCAWYGFVMRELHYMDRGLLWSVPILAYIGLGVHALWYRGRVDNPSDYLATLAYCALCVTMVALPLFFAFAGLSDNADKFIAALMFIVFWIGAGAYGHITGGAGLVSLAITMIGLRIYIVFLEAFGGLMMTGWGMVFAGVMMLVMIWGLRRINRFVRALIPGHGG